MNKVKFNELSLYESLTQRGLYIINGLKLHHHLANKNIFGLFLQKRNQKAKEVHSGTKGYVNLKEKKLSRVLKLVNNLLFDVLN